VTCCAAPAAAEEAFLELHGGTMAKERSRNSKEWMNAVMGAKPLDIFSPAERPCIRLPISTQSGLKFLLLDFYGSSFFFIPRNG
jgi:hypothetical protein